ncbi:MAG TPA: alpha/beta hydrolase, partial [Rectinemataceae bacterium]
MSVASIGAADFSTASKSLGPGAWEGKLTLRRAASAPPGEGNPDALSAEIVLKILAPGRGALLDMPFQSMFGYPLSDVSWSSTRLRFMLDALGPDEELKFDGFLTGGMLIGTAQSTSWRGSFLLKPKTVLPEPGEREIELAAGAVLLPASLRMPLVDRGKPPIVILLSGAGAADRNGNNYNVPGKSDSLLHLARGLAERGVASLRYDKRGSGEAYALEPRERVLTLDELADDAAEILRWAVSEGSFSRVLVAGLNEGAWVGALALARLERESIETDGLAVLSGTGESPMDRLRTMIASLDGATRAEAEGIVQSLLSGNPVPEPSEPLADFFSKRRLPWLSSWLRIDPPALFASLSAPVLFVRGGADLQVEEKDFHKLLQARPGSAARIVPTMNYALKAVESEDENYASFTDPDIPVSQELLDLLAAFAKAKPAPPSSLRYNP